MKLFLSSEGIPRPDLLQKLIGDSEEKPRVAIINNAQDPYPKDVATERKDKLVKLFLSLGFEPLETDLRQYEGKTTELAKHLQTCKLIWCSGGNVFWLRYVMKISGFDKIIKGLVSEGIVFGGWSAGSVVAGPSLKVIDLMDDPNVAPEIIWEGLGLVEYFIWPHWGKEKYSHLEKSAVEQMEKLPYESIKLADGKVVIVDNGTRTIIK